MLHKSRQYLHIRKARVAPVSLIDRPSRIYPQSAPDYDPSGRKNHRLGRHDRTVDIGQLLRNHG